MQRFDQYAERAHLEVLLVEDNPCDVVLFRQLLRRSSLSYSLNIAVDAVKAAEHLNSPIQPDVIFLDLNLPGKSGTEILAELKSDPVLAAIPVAVLTGSDDPQDRSTCVLLGADAYFTKAGILQDFSTLATEIESFLLRLPLMSQHKPQVHGYPATSAA